MARNARETITYLDETSHAAFSRLWDGTTTNPNADVLTYLDFEIEKATAYLANFTIDPDDLDTY